MAALDYWATLQPAAGLARRFAVSPPDGDAHLLWSVAVDIGQQDFSPARADDYPLTLVGAAGPQRADAFMRACGEAVERAALLPLAPLADDPRAPHMQAGSLWRAEPCAPSYAAVELASGKRVRVPAPAVDYPAADRDLLARFNVTPSGAAAGPTREAAVAAALRELLERDAATIAWARQARLPRLDLPALAHADQRLATLIETAERAGLEAAAAIAPTAAGADCVIGVVIDRRAGLAAAGISFADPAKAISEALQVRTVLIGVARHYEGAQPPAAITTDVDRARFWTTPQALAAIDRWLARLGPPRNVRTAATAVDGATIVDLTPRLPAAIRALGWHAVKALAPLQALPMSETQPWIRNPDRLTAPERDWGIACEIPPDQVADCPHPFI